MSGALIASIVLSYIGSRVTAAAHEKAQKKRLSEEAAGRARRTTKANERLNPLFQKVAKDVGPENEKKILDLEDIKNLKTFDKTQENSEVKIGQGLNLGGKELAQFTNLKGSSNAAAIKRNDMRKLFHSRFISPARTNSRRANFVDKLSLDRSRLGEELVGDRIGDDLAVAGISPDSGMLALGDMLRIAGMATGMYGAAGAAGGAGAATTTGTVGGDIAKMGINTIGPGASGTIAGTGAAGASAYAANPSLSSVFQGTSGQHGSNFANMFRTGNVDMGIWKPPPVSPFNYAYIPK